MLCLLLGPPAAAAPTVAPEPPPPALGQAVPAFELFDLAGARHRLADYPQPVVVLNFWAFWCDTWKSELPQLRELGDARQELGFALVAVSVDGQWAEARRRLRGAGTPASWGFPVLLDGRQALAKALGVRRVPTVIVLDRHRRVVWLHEAYPGNPAVLKAIRKALSH